MAESSLNGRFHGAVRRRWGRRPDAFILGNWERGKGTSALGRRYFGLGSHLLKRVAKIEAKNISANVKVVERAFRSFEEKIRLNIRELIDFWAIPAGLRSRSPRSEW